MYADCIILQNAPETTGFCPDRKTIGAVVEYIGCVPAKPPDEVHSGNSVGRGDRRQFAALASSSDGMP